MSGGSGHGYIPVVAGGYRACIIHYTENSLKIRDGQLVLVDAGAEYDNYLTDCTRTWPINKQFTKDQKVLYEAVLDVQLECIKLCREDENTSLKQIHRRSDELMLRNLTEIGFKITKSQVSQLYPHSVGHHVGLEIHDCSTITSDTKLKAKHVITIEPGVYVPRDSAFPPQFHGIGIRIEDTIAIQAKGSENLTFAPKTVEEVTAAMENLQY